MRRRPRIFILILRLKILRGLILLHGNRHHAADNREQRHFIRYDLDNVQEKRALKMLWNTNLDHISLSLPTFLTRVTLHWHCCVEIRFHRIVLLRCKQIKASYAYQCSSTDISTSNLLICNRLIQVLLATKVMPRLHYCEMDSCTGNGSAKEALTPEQTCLHNHQSVKDLCHGFIIVKWRVGPGIGPAINLQRPFKSLPNIHGHFGTASVLISFMCCPHPNPDTFLCDFYQLH